MLHFDNTKPCRLDIKDVLLLSDACETGPRIKLQAVSIDTCLPFMLVRGACRTG
jgi:hypothetical protein